MSSRNILDNPNWDPTHFEKVGKCAEEISNFADEYEGDDLFTPIENIIYKYFPFPAKPKQKGPPKSPHTHKEVMKRTAKMMEDHSRLRRNS